MAQYKTIAYGELHTTGSPMLAVSPLDAIIQREAKSGWKLHSVTPMEAALDTEIQGCGCLPKSMQKSQKLATNQTKKIIMLVFVKDDVPSQEVYVIPSTKPQAKTTTRPAKPKATTQKKDVDKESASVSVDEQEKINLYSFAKQQMDNRSYQAAYNCLIKIKGYKDVDELLVSLEDKI